MSYTKPLWTAEDILREINKIDKGPNGFEDDALASYLAWCTKLHKIVLDIEGSGYPDMTTVYTLRRMAGHWLDAEAPNESPDGNKSK